MEGAGAAPQPADSSLEPLLIETNGRGGGSEARTHKLCGRRMTARRYNELGTMFALVVLFVALAAMSSLGAALDLVTGVGPFLKAFWRATATALVLCPAAAIVLIRRRMYPSKPTAAERAITLSLAVRNGVACGLANAWWLGWFILSLNHTSIGHAYLFSNCHSVLIVGGRLVLRLPVNPLEVWGAMIAVAGGVVCSMESTVSTAHVQGPTPFGDFLACVSCLGGLVFVLLAKLGQQKLGVVPFTALMQITASFAFFIASCLFDPVAPSVLSPWDANTGVMGWVHPTATRLPVIVYIVVVPGLMGMVGYVTVMKFLAPIVISVVMLIEPVASAAIGVALNVSPAPGVFTYAGTAVVLGGLALVTVGSTKRASMTVMELFRLLLRFCSRQTAPA